MTPAPTRAVATMQRRMTAAEVERLAWQVRQRPAAAYYPTVSETSGQERILTPAEARWVLEVRGAA